MPRYPAFIAALATAALLSSACRSSRGTAGEDTGTAPAPADESAAVPVVVESHTPTPFDVFAIKAGERIRVGEVPGVGTVNLKVRRDYFNSDGTLRLLAVPVGAPGAVSSGALNVQPGQTVKWTLEADPALSTATVI